VPQLENSLINADDAGWQSLATAWLVVALALEEDRVDEALRRLSQISDPIGLATVVEGLSALESAQASGETGGKLRLQAAEMGLAIESQDSAQKLFWSMQKVRALRTLQQYAPAAALLTELSKQFPNNVDVQFQLAETLKLSGQFEPALAQWRRIALRTRPHSDGWYQAKYNVAWLLEAIGNRAEALQLLQYIQTVSPGWEKSNLRDEFEQLLAKCRQ
jgi:tetratricopeptide (TPR) repeat protein